MSALEKTSAFAPSALAGRICIVTGAGSGIGRAITLRLVELGAHVTGLGRRAEKLAETEAAAAHLPGRFRFDTCDIRDHETTAAKIAAASEANGLDLLVNNAGGQFYAPALAISQRGWSSVVDLNLNAAFNLIKSAHPYLARNRGAVVSISLSGIDRGIMGAAHSVAARAGVLGLSRTLAQEWASDGIRLNCIGPGIVFTENLDADARALIESDMSGIPLGRATDTNEVAELVAFLATNSARMITGQLLHIDGGAHIGAGVHGWRPEANA